VTRSGILSLAAVLSVLVVVSVPRLRTLAVQENEAEALATARLMAEALDSMAGQEPLMPVGRLLQSPQLASLADVELLHEGALLRRHGYLFEVAQLPGARKVVRAWPWAPGRTGKSTYLVELAPASQAITAARGTHR
jgi:hypothetical protein